MYMLNVAEIIIFASFSWFVEYLTYCKLAYRHPYHCEILTLADILSLIVEWLLAHLTFYKCYRCVFILYFISEI